MYINNYFIIEFKIILLIILLNNFERIYLNIIIFSNSLVFKMILKEFKIYLIFFLDIEKRYIYIYVKCSLPDCTSVSVGIYR